MFTKGSQYLFFAATLCYFTCRSCAYHNHGITFDNSFALAPWDNMVCLHLF